MPVGYSSPSRNFFLLGAVGGDVVTNFFKGVDRSLDTFNSFRLKQLNYAGSVGAEQNYIIGGNKYDGTSYLAADTHGWFEKRTFNSDTLATATAYEVTVSSTIDDNVEINDIKLDSSGNTYIAGRADDSCFVGKYDSSGNVVWNSTSFTGDAIFYGLALDSSSNLYACGQTENADEDAIVQRFDNDGNVSWGKTISTTNGIVKLQRCAINSKGHLVAVGYIEDATHEGEFQTKFKGYIIKLDIASGDILWTRTLEDRYYYSSIGLPESVICEDITIDNDDEMYVVGRMLWDGAKYHSFLVKYTAEGNIAWQTQTPRDNTHRVQHFAVKTDSDTKQTVVFGDYYNTSTADSSALISKYDQAGNLLWRRKVTSSEQGSSWIYDTRLDADSTFYYMAFTDDNTNVTTGDPDRYVFGKVSTSGNGLGSFQYNDGTGRTIDYTILTVGDTLARLWDGSVRQDTTDFITYPYSANKLLFDDLATKISNKKAQIAEAGTYQESGSPSIRPADFQELNLLGDNVSDRIWNDTSGKGNNGVASLTEPFLGAGGVSFDGTGDYLTVGGPLQTTNAGLDLGTNDFCIEYWVYQEVSTYASECFLFDLRETSNNTSTTAFIVNASNQLRWYWGNADRITVNNFIEQNQWTHHAFVRNGDVFTVYKNGTSAGSATIVGQNLGTVPTPCVIGAARSGGSPVQAKYSNFRITIEDPVYTGNFTPPTTPLTAITGTELLTCQGDTIADASANNFTITANGNAAPTDDGGPTWNASGWWDYSANKQYIDVNYPDNLIATGFTVEFWFNGISTLPGQAAQFLASQGRMGLGATDNDSTWRIERNNFQDGTIEFNVNNGVGFNQNELISTNFPNGTWHHCVCTFYNGSSKIYKNGVLDVSSGSYTGTPTHPHNDEIIRIGGRYDASILSFRGSIGEARIYPRALTAAQVFQNYNATREKYTGVPASTDPGLTSTRTPA